MFSTSGNCALSYSTLQLSYTRNVTFPDISCDAKSKEIQLFFVVKYATMHILGGSATEPTYLCTLLL